MALPHSSPGEPIDVAPYGNSIGEKRTGTLFKTDGMEVLRLVLPAGKTIAEHKAPGVIAVQCIEGRVKFIALNKTVELAAGTMIYLPAAEPHSLQSIETSSLLVFISLHRQVSLAVG